MEPRRRTVLDEGKQREICAILAVGCSRLIAARYVGCHRNTIRSTAMRDKNFLRAIRQAESKHEILHLTHINAAAKEGRYWRAAAWALERKYPTRYGHRDPHMFTIEQVSQVLAQFADVILEEVPKTAQRKRILARLNDLTSGLRRSTAKGTGT
jgi:hypothetical protein